MGELDGFVDSRKTFYVPNNGEMSSGGDLGYEQSEGGQAVFFRNTHP